MTNSNKNSSEALMKPFNAQQASQEVLDLATSYTQTYINHVENTPFDLQRKVTRLREIDMACQEHVTKVELLYETFVQKKEQTSVKLLIQMQRLLAKCKELGDEKIVITEEVNEILEGKNRNLDSEKQQFLTAHDPDNKELYNGKRENNGKYDGAKTTKRPRRSNHHQLQDKHKYEKMYEPRPTPIIPTNTTPVVAVAAASPVVEDRVKRTIKSNRDKKEDKKEKKEEVKVSTAKTTEAASSPTSSIIPSISATTTNNGKQTTNKTTEKKTKKKKRKAARQSDRHHVSEPVSPLMDIPIDPDEPTYCVCNQVSFGQMIGCDNKKCPIEWFHFSCVGLTNKPKGNWYCPDCIQKKDRKKDKRDK